MLGSFRLVYVCAALFATAAGLLVTASLFMADRAPTSSEFLPISLAVSAIFLGLAVVLLGVQRHVAGIAEIARRRDGAAAQALTADLGRLLAYLLAGGAFACAVFGSVVYGILERIDQGFAVFG
jgi:hypothetical protein